jgi:hypothetical protein
MRPLRSIGAKYTTGHMSQLTNDLISTKYNHCPRRQTLLIVNKLLAALIDHVEVRLDASPKSTSC